MEIKINIIGLDQLTEAIVFMASALAHANGMKNTVEAIEQMKTTKVETVPVETAPLETVAAPVVPTNETVYTLDELSKAAVGLMDKGLMDGLMNLLSQYGVNSLPDLDKSVYSQFALKLREMGADI